MYILPICQVLPLFHDEQGQDMRIAIWTCVKASCCTALSNDGKYEAEEALGLL